MIFFGKKHYKVSDIKKDKPLPTHVAIIPDGNGRWASKRGLPRNMGHREGANTLREVVEFCAKIGIKYVTVYAFSTENWKRPKSEVDALMELLLEFLKKADKELSDKNVRIRVIGDIEGLPEVFHEEIPKVMKMTEKNDGMILNIALNYGGRDEIVTAVKKIIRDIREDKLEENNINEETISERLYTANIPDPDLIIRTSGEMRSSNFLIWQSAYSELWFTDVLWPDIKETDIIEAIVSYQKRNRRFGGI